MTTFHFNRRDASFRVNINAIDGRDATIVTKDGERVYITHAVVGNDVVRVQREDNWDMVYHEDNWWTIPIRDIEMVAVEVD